MLARKTKEDAMETRNKLLEAALNVFCKKNYSNVTMTEIAAYVGMTKGAIYWHFKNKNDILVQVIEETFRQTEGDFININGSPDSLSGIRCYYKNALMFSHTNERYKKIHTLMLHRHEWPDEVKNNVLSILKGPNGPMEREKRLLETIIIKEQAEGRIRKDVSPAEVSMLIVAVFHGLFVLLLSEVVSFDFVAHTDFIFDAFKKELEYKDD